MNNENGVQSISQRFLSANDLFGLEFKEGLMFFEVAEVERTKYKPYEQLEDIESGTSLDDGFQRLTDDGSSSGDDILEVPGGDEDVVLHASIGHKPFFIRRYTRYPEDSSKIGTIPNLSAQRSNTGDAYGYVDGSDSPYDGPSDYEELFIPFGVNLNFDFYNPDPADSHKPILHIRMAKYRVRALDPTDSFDQAGIRRIVQPGSPIPIGTAGVLGNQVSVPGKARREYGVEPMSREDVVRRVR